MRYNGNPARNTYKMSFFVSINTAVKQVNTFLR